jgi:hypothetical protein
MTPHGTCVYKLKDFKDCSYFLSFGSAVGAFVLSILVSSRSTTDFGKFVVSSRHRQHEQSQRQPHHYAPPKAHCKRTRPLTRGRHLDILSDSTR